MIQTWHTICVTHKYVRRGKEIELKKKFKMFNAGLGVKKSFLKLYVWSLTMEMLQEDAWNRMGGYLANEQFLENYRKRRDELMEHGMKNQDYLADYKKAFGDDRDLNTLNKSLQWCSRYSEIKRLTQNSRNKSVRQLMTKEEEFKENAFWDKHRIIK